MRRRRCHRPGRTAKVRSGPDWRVTPGGRGGGAGRVIELPAPDDVTPHRVVDQRSSRPLPVPVGARARARVNVDAENRIRQTGRRRDHPVAERLAVCRTEWSPGASRRTGCLGTHVGTGKSELRFNNR